MKINVYGAAMLAASLFASAACAKGTFDVAVDHADAVYSCGEKAVFTVKAVRAEHRVPVRRRSGPPGGRERHAGRGAAVQDRQHHDARGEDISVRDTFKG